MTHSERIQAIRERLRAASKDSWEFERISFDDGGFYYASPMRAKFDAELIANAPDDLEYLLTKLEVAVETIRFEINDCPVGEGCSDPRCKRLKLALQKIEGMK